MSLRPVLASGVALVSAAAVVAATPEVLRPPTLEVAAVRDGGNPAEIAPGEYDLTALSMLSALNAFFDGYLGADPLRGPAPNPSVDTPPAGGVPAGAVPRWSGGEEPGQWQHREGIAAPVPVLNVVDDAAASPAFVPELRWSDIPNELLDQITEDYGMRALVELIAAPVEALAGVVGLHLDLRGPLQQMGAAVTAIIDLALFLPAQLVAALRDPVAAIVRVITSLFTRPQESAEAKSSIEALRATEHPGPTGAGDLGAQQPVPTPTDAAGETRRGSHAGLRAAITERTSGAKERLRDLKTEIKQAREDRKAEWAEAKEQRRQQREEKFKGRFGGRGETVEGADSGTPGGPADTSESTGNDPAE